MARKHPPIRKISKTLSRLDSHGRKVVAIDLSKKAIEGRRLKYQGPESEMPPELFEKYCVVEGLLNTPELCAVMGLDRITLEKYRDIFGLPFIKSPTGRYFYRISDVNRWIESFAESSCGRG